jgi:hypothetical protein
MLLAQFLEELGARERPHTTHTLFDHLVRTAAILKRWGASAQLWKAGLFHSCYGTEFFREALLPWAERDRVIALVGAECEATARLFCVLDRDSVYRALERGEPYVVDTIKPKGVADVSAAGLSDLVWILWANVLEHVPQLKLAPALVRRSREGIDRTAHLLPAIALAELREGLGPAESADVPRLHRP